MKNYFLLSLLLTGCLSIAQPLKTTFQYATAAQAKALLATEDEYTRHWSRFDLDAVTHKPGATNKDMIAFTVAQARDWTDTEKKSLDDAITKIDADVARGGFVLPLPAHIQLVKTTLEEGGGAEAYTRGEYIVLNQEIVDNAPDSLEGLLLHELFHVLSRHDAAFRAQCYALIGFTVANEITLPLPLRNMTISNPDAPRNDSFITVKKDGKDIQCVMLLFATTPYTKGSFFDYLNVGLIQVEGAKEKQPVLVNGSPVLLKLNEVENFVEQVGQNTKYIINPEEILADNFMDTLMERKNAPSVWLLDKIGALLKKG